jgi:hypothetical protein
MVSKRVHFLYMLTWVLSLLLVAAFGGLVYSLVQAPDNVVRSVPPLLGVVNPFLLLGVLAFVIVCTSLALGVYTILHTHRLMGSAYRIGVVLREINEGKPTRVHLRDGDFFLDIADEINRLADVHQGAAAKPAGTPPGGGAEPAAGGAQAPAPTG